MNGILVSKNNIIFLAIIGIMTYIGCKEKVPSPENLPEAEYKTNIRFATKADNYTEKSSYQRLSTGQTEITSTKFQMEGPAWENEHVGFRNYFDARNSMDIFGKTTTEMVLDSVGIDEDYHVLQDWGMDILKVGNSLGAGGIAMIINDSIYRVGVGAKGTFRIIEESPTTSSLKFDFDDWKIHDRTYSVSHTITISEGTHYYMGKIDVEGLKGDEFLAIGLVDHGVSQSEVETENYMIIYTHGDQDVNHKNLGMGLAMKTSYVSKLDSAAMYKGNVDNTILMLSKKNGVEYKFFAGWELQDEQFKSKSYFENIILSELK